MPERRILLPTRRRALLAALLTGPLFALAQEPAGLFFLAPLCLLPLLAALAGRGARARLGLGAAAGTAAAWASAVGPGAVGAAEFLARPLWQGAAVTFFSGTFFGGLGFATFSLLAGDPLRGGAAAVLRAGAAFAAAELVRAKLFTGLPWLLLAYALAPAPGLAQLAAWGGVALASFCLAAIPAAILLLFLPGERRAGALALAALSLAVALAGVSSRIEANLVPAGRAGPGTVRAAEGPAPPEGALRVALAQPALPMAAWADPSRAAETVARLVSLSAKDPRAPFDLVVWPENAIQVLLPANRHLVERALAGLGNRADRLLLGAPRSSRERPGLRHNSALLYGGSAEPVAVHDKVHLLPFFEYLPGGLGFLGLPTAGLAPGRTPGALPLETTRIGPLICYEVLYPEIARAQVRDGAGLLANLSNDAWFGRSGGAEQHLSAAVLLAIQLRRPLLRATPTGVTAAIDARGRLVASLPADEPGLLVVDVIPGRVLSGYARIGESLGWLALLATAVWTARDARPRGRRFPSGRG